MFDRMIIGLNRIGVRNVTVVIGHLASTLRQHATTKSSELTENNVSFDFIQNDSLDIGNIYSFWLARSRMTDEFILLNSDVVFDYGILDLLLSSPHDSALLIDDRKTLGAEEMKVSVNNRKFVTDISKQLDPSKAAGEYIGIMKISPDTAHLVLDKVELLLNAKKCPLYYEDAFKLVARENECLWTCSTEGLPWTEIDTEQDLNFAIDTIVPKLQKILRQQIS